MKLKTLAVITLLVLGCSASYGMTFGFTSTTGGLYCNYEVLSVYGGTIWQGVDNLTAACGAPVNATVAGAGTAVTKPNNPVGFAVKGVGYGDNIYDAFGESYTGAQWYVLSGTAATSCTAKKPKYSWVGYASVSGTIFGYNYGCLSATIPGGGRPTKGTTSGHVSLVR